MIEHDKRRAWEEALRIKTKELSEANILVDKLKEFLYTVNKHSDESPFIKALSDELIKEIDSDQN